MNDLPEELVVTIVCVRGLNALAEQSPVTWVLVASEPIATAAQIEAVVDHYPIRWLIEEFFGPQDRLCFGETSAR